MGAASSDDELNFEEDEVGLTDSLKEEVLRCARLPMQYFLISMYARILAVSQQVQQSTVSSFLDSPDFKEHITRRLQAGLLDPNIPHYIQGTTARFVRHMTENPASYKIPEAVQLHFMHSKPFSSAVGSVLSNTRGEMKRKYQKSITEKQDIYTLCQKLAIRGFQLSEDHANMISFVRMYLVKYNGIDWKNEESQPSFWSYIDRKMDKFRKKSPASQARALRNNMKEDKKQFPVPKSNATSLPPVVHVPQWQTDIGVAIITMSEYQMDADQEQEEEPAPESEHGPGNTGPGNTGPGFTAAPYPDDDAEQEEPEPEQEEEEQHDTAAGSVPEGHNPAPPPGLGLFGMDIDNGMQTGRAQANLGFSAPPNRAQSQSQAGPVRNIGANAGSSRANPMGTQTPQPRGGKSAPQSGMSLRPRKGANTGTPTPSSREPSSAPSGGSPFNVYDHSISGTGMGTVGWPGT